MLDRSALFKIPCGIFLLTARAAKDNACIINTVMQVTAEPVIICVAVNKTNLTHDMIVETGIFNVSTLTESAPFSLYSVFGYQSGRKTDKFQLRTDVTRSQNGLYYLKEYSNACFSAKVKQTIGFPTHSVFFAEVTEIVSLSEERSATYDYYQNKIKPQVSMPTKESASRNNRYICEVCGYVYEGKELPPDFICPVCKHGAEVFRKLT